MSVLIKGMKMPKDCEHCGLSKTDSAGFFGCSITENIVLRKTEENRPSWCPLVEVPPHGRLIDEKQIPYIDLNADMPQSKVRVWTTFKDKIDRLPTIIEAEEGAENEIDRR